MSKTTSKKFSGGVKAADFSLLEPLTGKTISLMDVPSEKGAVIVFMCNHCPYVLHILESLVNVSQKYSNLGIGFIGINSNDVENYPDDSPELMSELCKSYNIQFPYLFDETQQVAKSYDAACTPDIYVFNENNSLVYHGQYDGSRPGSQSNVDGSSLCTALDCLLSSRDVDIEQVSSLGCNIKWK